MTVRIKARAVDGSKKRERAVIRAILSHQDIHHNGLKRRVVPRYMAIKTFERIIRDLIERKVVNVTLVKNRKHYSVVLGFPDSSVKIHLGELIQLVDEMRSRLVELKGKYPRLPKKKKEQTALGLSHMYYDTRLQVVGIFDMLGRKKPVSLGEYDIL